MKNDPASILGRGEMGWLQIVGVALCVMLLALDGFDVLSISFASPGIAAEWGIDRAALGLVLSMELIGMALGSIAIGTLADRIGRRPTILGCLMVMTVGMVAAANAHDVTMLSLFRLGTGLGIGGMLACANAMTAELANDRNRDLLVALMAGGYPIGAALGGSVASALLVSGDWRSVFLFGAGATAIMLPLAWIFLPESIPFLAKRGGEGALARINRTLARMGHAPADRLEAADAAPAIPLLALFQPGLIAATLLLTLAYFAHIMTFYFILKWVPKIVVDMGFAAAKAGGVLVWANVGGAIGAVLFSLLTRRFDVRLMLIGALLLSAVMVSLFGQVRPDLGQLAWVAGGAGIFTNAAVVGIYALVARSFPAEVRAGGTGFVIGIGRGGAALGPILAGLLFAGGTSLAIVSLTMAAGSLIAAVALLLLGKLGRTQTAPHPALV